MNYEWKPIVSYKIPKNKLPKPEDIKTLQSELYWADGECHVRVAAKVEVPPVDISEDIWVDWVKSQHTDGYYIGMFYKDKCVVAFGLDDKTKIFKTDKGIKLVKSENANVSFRVFDEYKR